MKSLTYLFLPVAVSLGLSGCTGFSDSLKSLQSIEVDAPLLDSAFVSERKQEIESYTPDRSKIPGKYFSYYGFRDFYRWPLVYPYSINAVDSRDDGFIRNEAGINDIENDGNDSKQIQMLPITSFTFNDKVLAAETVDDSVNPAVTGYALLHFGTEEVEVFKTKPELMEVAGKFGIGKGERFLNLEEYSEL